MERDFRAIERTLIISFFFNLIATAAKLSVGIWTGALSLIADGLDTLFDGLANVIGVIAVRMGSRPPDADHPYGHRKFETIAALFIATMLFITAWELATGAIDRFFAGEAPVVNAWSIAALAFGGAVQGLTGLWEIRRGRDLQSEILVADARHTITSLYVSAAVLAGLVLVYLGFPWADPLVALFVAVVIAKIGVETVSENVPALVDRAPITEDTIGQVVADVEGVESFHRVRSRGTADSIAVDLHVRVDPRLSVNAANAIADEVRRRLLNLDGVDDVTVHLEAQRGPESTAALHEAVKLIADEEGVTIHEFWIQQLDAHIGMHLHVGVDPNLTLAEAHDQVDRLERTIQERLPEVASIYSHIETAVPEILPTARVSQGLHERIERAIEAAAEEIPALSYPHEIQIHQVEGRLFIAAEALIDGSLSVSEAHDLSTQMQDIIRARVPNAGEVLVHLEPKGELM
ncbi:MAG: cation diffusion facilitator family transporter [Caldilineaceae bacterium]|nr:cation diffusion facilitator family transporter [Caldilineaceae bacterium]